MKMDVESIIRKLTSRKFFTMLAGQVTMILTLMNVGDNTIAKVVAIIGGFATMVAYIFSEAWVDAKSLESNTTKVISAEPITFTKLRAYDPQIGEATEIK